MFKDNKESKIILTGVGIIFAIFLILPTGTILLKSFQHDSGLTLNYYIGTLLNDSFLISVKNSLLISTSAASITTILAFILSYTINNTNVNKHIKKCIRVITTMPMLLPTITYGFAIIYSFGKQGLITKLLGFELFNIYGFNGLLLGYVIYTLPTTFLLINNTFKYIDKKFIVVSRVMGDNPLKSFYITVLRPMMGTLVGAFIQSFFLSFTDFGIPASVGGNFSVISTTLYNEMLGSVPNFNNGAVIAVIMLLPSVLGILLLTYLERFNFRYNKISPVELKENKSRDLILGTISIGIVGIILSIFGVIFIVPFVKSYPYDMTFTLDNIKNIMATSGLSNIYVNSLKVAVLSAIFGTFIAYVSALATSRSTMKKKYKQVIESIALITNTIPGMVLGIGFLLTFSGTEIQNTFFILIVCNIVHFFSTPYFMMKNSLSKLNGSFETTAKLLGDSYTKTVAKIITPSVSSSLLEVFSYYFTNSMVTISAVIFLTGAKTMVITTKIKELQHYAKFDEIFVLSVLIFITNVLAKSLFSLLATKKQSSNEGKEISERRIRINKFSKLAVGVCLLMVISGTVVGFSPQSEQDEQVVIYSNADEDVIVAMKNALDTNGYSGRYIIQSFGTSELGGKILAEGKTMEADLITMSSYYVDTAQKNHDMFLDLDIDVNTINEFPEFHLPVTALQGTLIMNTEIMEENNLEAPQSIKDLANDEYKGLISIPDITGSSTGWLLIQGLINEYGESEAHEIMTKIVENAGPHLESSGSAPLKKVRAGEVAIAFGLRPEAVNDKNEGLPIDYVDPIEGNFSLSESIAVIDKDEENIEKEELAKEIAECIIVNAREEILNTYQNVLYEGEEIDESISAKYPKVFKETLTVDLLEKHKDFSESCK